MRVLIWRVEDGIVKCGIARLHAIIRYVTITVGFGQEKLKETIDGHVGHEARCQINAIAQVKKACIHYFDDHTVEAIIICEIFIVV